MPTVPKIFRPVTRNTLIFLFGLKWHLIRVCTVAEDLWYVHCDQRDITTICRKGKFQDVLSLRFFQYALLKYEGPDGGVLKNVNL